MAYEKEIDHFETESGEVVGLKDSLARSDWDILLDYQKIEIPELVNIISIPLPKQKYKEYFIYYSFAKNETITNSGTVEVAINGLGLTYYAFNHNFSGIPMWRFIHVDAILGFMEHASGHNAEYAGSVNTQGVFFRASSQGLLNDLSKKHGSSFELKFSIRSIDYMGTLRVFVLGKHPID